MVVAGLLRHLMRDQPARRLEVEHRDLRRQQRALDPLALARHLALEQRHQDAHARQKMPADRSATGMPTRTGPWPGRPVIDISPPMPWAIWSKPGAVAVRPALPEPRDAGIDEARVERLQRGVVDAEPGLDVRPVVLDQDVGAAHQLAEDLDPLRRFEVERQAALVAVQVLEIGTVARPAEAFAGSRAAPRS